MLLRATTPPDLFLKTTRHGLIRLSADDVRYLIALGTQWRTHKEDKTNSVTARP
jgi:hypothetical protein